MWIPNFTKIRPVWAELFQADGRTDIRTGMTNLTVAFHNFANAPQKAHNWKMGSLLWVQWKFFENHTLLSPALTAANFSTHFHSRNLKNRCSNKAQILHLLFWLRLCTFASILQTFAHEQVWPLQRGLPSEINICRTRILQCRHTTRAKFQLQKYIFCRTDHEHSVLYMTS